MASYERSHRLRPGMAVRLPDGEIGVVVAVSGDDVHVVQPEKILGRGPWIFHRGLVEILGYGWA